MSDSNQEAKFYDFHCTGLAYLNRLRLVTPDGGDSYLSVTLAVLRGKADAEGKVAKTWVDCNIVGNRAKARAKTLLDHIIEEGIDPDDVKIMANVKFGDLEPKPFIYRKGPKAGQPGFSLKGRLLQITHVKVDGFPFDFGDEPEEKGEEPVRQSGQQPEPDAMTGELLPAEDPVQQGNQQQVPDAVDKPTLVKLSKDDPDFMQRKTELKRQGYRWNPDQMAWCLPAQVA